jgi:hypothetical protein
MGDSDDGAEAIFLLVAILVALPILLMIWLLVEYHEEISAAATKVARGIWKAHLAMGALVVWLVRDVPVAQFWNDDYGGRAERCAIVCWLVPVPIMLAVSIPAIVFFFGALLLGMLSGAWAGSTAFGLLMALSSLPSTAAVIYGYFQEYHHGPLRHHRLIRFVRQYFEMRAELQLFWHRSITQLRIWLNTKIYLPLKVALGLYNAAGASAESGSNEPQ